jgi:hypothetical protein
LTIIPVTANSRPWRPSRLKMVSTSALSATIAAGSNSSAPKQKPLAMNNAVKAATSPRPRKKMATLVAKTTPNATANVRCLPMRLPSHSQKGTAARPVRK